MTQFKFSCKFPGISMKFSSFLNDQQPFKKFRGTPEILSRNTSWETLIYILVKLWHHTTHTIWIHNHHISHNLYQKSPQKNSIKTSLKIHDILNPKNSSLSFPTLKLLCCWFETSTTLFIAPRKTFSHPTGFSLRWKLSLVSIPKRGSKSHE